MDIKQATSLRNEASQLARSIDGSYFELGRILHCLKTETITSNNKTVYVYEFWGHDTRYEYAAKELGLKRSRVNNLTAIYNHFAITLNGKYDLKNLFSVTKMVQLARVLKSDCSKQDIKTWVDKATKLGSDQLHAEVDSFLGKSANTKICFSLSLTSSQDENIKSAIKYAIGHSDGAISTNGEAMNLIVSEWMANSSAMTSTKLAKKLRSAA